MSRTAKAGCALVAGRKLFDADVKLPRANLEPTATTRAQRFGLFDFLQIQQAAKEVARFVLTTLWTAS